MRLITIMLICFLLTGTRLQADVKIIQTEGKVMVRPGLEENWDNARNGLILKDIDTILSSEGGRVVLELEDGGRFTLGANTILDISDIRKIQQRELFMYLMSQKIDNLETPGTKDKIQVGNVSVVHGQSKKVSSESEAPHSKYDDWYPLELNGALALFENQYYPNTIIKCIKIQNKYGFERDNGRIDYYIARSFEEINDQGQARDAYNRALEEAGKSKKTEQSWVKDAREALKRLDKE